ncbi:MAG: DUF3303 family protein [Phyllobacteriaceae bacterium]|nr:DUF3303 family protein [Phyllobacteriaceae bacterium]
MLFMVIERFRDDDMVPIYRRLRDAGRGLPEGLTFLDSWVAADFSRCFQLMACDDATAIQAWALHWRGLGARFEVVPVVPGGDTRALIAPRLDEAP